MLGHAIQQQAVDFCRTATPVCYVQSFAPGAVAGCVRSWQGLLNWGLWALVLQSSEPSDLLPSLLGVPCCGSGYVGLDLRAVWLAHQGSSRVRGVQQISVLPSPYQLTIFALSRYPWYE